MELKGFYNMDCMEGMKEIPDKYFELAIVDPPYFNGPQKPNYYKGTKQKTDVGIYKTLEKSWEPPNKDYFDQLIRISKNQIIWGINYFNYLLPGGRIVWIKGVENSPFSMADIAYQSFYNRIDMFKYLWSGFQQENMKGKEQRFHPTQKPIALYKWLLTNYAKQGDKILDTHVGSASSLIACEDLGFGYLGFELDEDYYKQAVLRLEEYRNQLKLGG